MSRNPLPLCVGDVSAFARSLRRQLDGLERAPGHVEMLNCIARAGGYRNFQHYKAQAEACGRLAEPRTETPLPEINYKRVKRTIGLFDADARLTRWPKKFSMRLLCLWGLWSQLPARSEFTEREISDWLEQRHLFGDYALLRRLMIDHGLMFRTPDGRTYRRNELSPTPEAVELIRALPRQVQAAAPSA